MPTNLIEVIAICPECETEFENEIDEADLLSDPEEPIEFKCPDCCCEFEQAYTFAAGVVTLLPEVTITEEGEEIDESDVDDESEMGDDEDED